MSFRNLTERRGSTRLALAALALAVAAALAFFLGAGKRGSQRVDAVGPDASRVPAMLPTAALPRDAKADPTSGETIDAIEHRVRAPEPELPSQPPPEPATAAAFSVRVSLVDADGAPIASSNASVAARDARGGAVQAERIGANRFELRELEPGSWWIRARAPGRIDGARELVVPDPRAGIELELVLESARTVRIALVTPDGLDFESVRPKDLRAPQAIATRERPLRWLSELGTPELLESCGSFVERERADLGAPYLGSMQLECDPPLWISLHLADDVLESKRLEAGADELRFVLDPDELARCFGELSLRAVDARTRLPLETAVVRLEASGDHAQTHVGSGELRFSGVTAGPGSVEIGATRYEPQRREFVLARGEHKDLGEIALERSELGTLIVRVLGAEGGLPVLCRWADRAAFEPGRRASPQLRAAAATAGELRVPFEHGRWVLWAEAPLQGGKLRSRLHEVEMRGERAEVELVLEPIAPLVFEPSSRALRVWIVDARGLLAQPFPLQLGPSPERVELVPGVYELVAGDERRVVDLPPQGATVSFDRGT